MIEWVLFQTADRFLLFVGIPIRVVLVLIVATSRKTQVLLLPAISTDEDARGFISRRRTTPPTYCTTRWLLFCSTRKNRSISFTPAVLFVLLLLLVPCFDRSSRRRSRPPPTLCSCWTRTQQKHDEPTNSCYTSLLLLFVRNGNSLQLRVLL